MCLSPTGEANSTKTSRFGLWRAADSMAHACLPKFELFQWNAIFIKWKINIFSTNKIYIIGWNSITLNSSLQRPLLNTWFQGRKSFSQTPAALLLLEYLWSNRSAVQYPAIDNIDSSLIQIHWSLLRTLDWFSPFSKNHWKKLTFLIQEELQQIQWVYSTIDVWRTFSLINKSMQTKLIWPGIETDWVFDVVNLIYDSSFVFVFPAFSDHLQWHFNLITVNMLWTCLLQCYFFVKYWPDLIMMN